MPKNLVIVESPTKARTISRFLSGDFKVLSSLGHVRDLPSSTLGVDTEHNFEPHYIIPKKARSAVAELKKEARGAAKIILATDEDREGEAIAWHLDHVLGSEGATRPKRGARQTERIVFHEITKRAIEEALKHPRPIDEKLVDAQQARRILDRLVGYKLSPFLWKKIYRGLSAGRVQSVAVRLIVEREREIQSFKKEEYWTIVARFEKDGLPFEATLARIGEQDLEKFSIPDRAAADKILAALDGASWRVSAIEKKAVSKNPPPPFVTSTLQQEAFSRLRFSAKQTMMLAQQLYEGVEIGGGGATGLITYMRTDSLNLSEEAIHEASAFIKKEFGERYVLATPRRFKTKTKGAQEAHEAIRPTDPARTPDELRSYLDPRQLKLYELIWKRFLATQMPPAIFDNTAVFITASPDGKNPPHLFRAGGQTIIFDGFLKIYPLKIQEALLPHFQKDEALLPQSVSSVQHFTEPPPRYSEATLIKILEKYGIGRPSTYAPIISTIQERGYVEKDEKRRLQPTETGFLVNDMLVEHFPGVVDVEFTAKVEAELDEIAAGEKEWQPVIRTFYEPFAKNLEEKYEAVEKKKLVEETNEVCEKCGKPMVIRTGRFGKFLACSGFPECRNTKTIRSAAEDINMPCPKCGDGKVVIKRTRKKKIFYGCSRYPECDWASWTDPRKDAKTRESKTE